MAPLTARLREFFAPHGPLPTGSWTTGNLPRAGASHAVGGAIALLLFMAASMALGTFGFYHWGIQFGFLFTVFWCQPLSRWPWLLGASVLASALMGAVIAGSVSQRWLEVRADPVLVLIGTVPYPFLVAAGAWLLKRSSIDIRGEATSAAMRHLHAGILLAAGLASAKDVVYVIWAGRAGDVRHLKPGNFVELGLSTDIGVLANFALTHLTGAFVGALMVASLAWWLFSRRRDDGSRAILVKGLLVLLPVVAAYVALNVGQPSPGLSELCRLALVTVVVAFALAFGWRGASLALFATSTAIGVQDHFGGPDADLVWMQLFVAIVGSMGLLLGATRDDLHRERFVLDVVRGKEARLARDLRATAARNVHAEETERRRVAAELHDELGQSITALQTRVVLRDRDGGGDAELRGDVRELAAQMRLAVAHLLDALHPPSLQALGLYGALDRGPLRQVAERSGLDFRVGLQGDARLLRSLTPAVCMAAFRIAQGAVVNVVRHARAASCEVRLRVGERGGSVVLFIRVLDDGEGTGMQHSPGHGLRTMRDRVDALGGRLVVRDAGRGFKVHAFLPDATGSGGG